MPKEERVLDPAAAQAYYDRFGKKQDAQGFYEDPALDDLIVHSSFQSARDVFEFGCGTGKLAARLLEGHLPSTANYLGCDISPVMIGLAGQRLLAYGDRAHVVLSDGYIQFPLSDHSVDRVVSCYVLDLLSDADIRQFFTEAGRVIAPGGKVCIASLTEGVNLPSRIVSSLWSSIFRLSPAIVGGCRPIHVDAFVDLHAWQVSHRRVVAPFGVPSEVQILVAKNMPNGAAN